MTSEPMTAPAEELSADVSCETEAKQAQDPRELLTELRTRFEVFRNCQPLAIGIDKAVRARLPEANRKALRIALSMHTHCNRYLRLLAKAEKRFNLDGEPVAEVSEEHRQFATAALKERLQRQGEQMIADKPDKPSSGKRFRPQKQVNGAQANDKNTTTKAREKGRKYPEKSENPTMSASETGTHDESSPEPRAGVEQKPDRKKHAAKKAEKTTSNAKSQSATLSEKLALLTEKFGRK
ncbi:MAG: ProQ/FinO family protein [Betaproteobacteria bacterium]|nr:ProQ/FinO family protein [Betaproteobacteria bacterium]